MSAREQILAAAAALESALAAQRKPKAWVGLDGFVDHIVHAVDKRRDADNYTTLPTITSYAERIAAAAGKSTNIELVTQQIKLGGNGPLMSEALGRLGATVHYVGAVGWPQMDAVFEPLKGYGPVHTVAPPGVTIAIEFSDGKIMNGRMEGLRQVTFDNVVARMGGEAAFDASLRGADLVGIVNWTMIPFLTSVLRGMQARVAGMGAGAPRIVFFDLCDPAKRTDEDLLEGLRVMASFSGPNTTAILGLNEAESESVARVLGVAAGGNDGAALIVRARGIASALGISEVMIHPTRRASAWGADGEGTIEGPYCQAPKLTTGAGDHFNGGYSFARLLGLKPAHAVVIGKCVSGFYVRNCRGPSAAEVASFARDWAEGRLAS